MTKKCGAMRLMRKTYRRTGRTPRSIAHRLEGPPARRPRATATCLDQRTTLRHAPRVSRHALEKPVSVPIFDELFSTKDANGVGLCDALREAARARGFTVVEPSEIKNALTAARVTPLSAPSGKAGARVRADFGPHAQPIATAAARALGVPVTVLSVSGTAASVDGQLDITLTVRAMQIDRAGKPHAIRVEVGDADYDQDDEVDWANVDELLRAGHDHASNMLGEAAVLLEMSIEGDGRPAHTLLRPTATPRVAELAALTSISKGHELAKQPDGRVLVKITLEDGKRLAYLSAAEAAELEELLSPRSR